MGRAREGGKKVENRNESNMSVRRHFQEVKKRERKREKLKRRIQCSVTDFE
mgnify:CR=1 FL=1